MIRNTNKGFTLIETLLVIGIIVILTTIVVVAINPSRQFIKVKNTQREITVKLIHDAVFQYSIDHRGVLPAGIDSNLRMMGTANSGCDVVCGPIEEILNWHDLNWSYRKKITIDHSMVTDNLTDFPVLISTISSDLSLKSQHDGDDILFTSSDGTTKIPHEIEYYASSTGELVAWVKTNLSSTTDTYLYMYYGNSKASNQQQITDVWSNGYSAVWHLEEKNNTYFDSTLNNNNGVLIDSDSDSIRGINSKIGRGLDFNGDADYIAIPDNNTLDLNAFTVEAWVKFDVVTGYLTQKTIAGTSYQTFSSNWDLQTRTANRMRAGSGNCSGGFMTGDGPATITTGTWYYFVYSFGGSGSYQKLYYNGTNTNSQYRSSLITCKGNNDIIRIGARGGSVGGYMNGIMDELKISNIQRSNQWISTSYNNQNFSSAFLSFEEEESIVYNITQPSCLDLSLVLLDDYLAEIPYDSFYGSPEKTYYAIRNNKEGIIEVISCSPEL